MGLHMGLTESRDLQLIYPWLQTWRHGLAGSQGPSIWALKSEKTAKGGISLPLATLLASEAAVRITGDLP